MTAKNLLSWLFSNPVDLEFIQEVFGLDENPLSLEDELEETV